MKEYEPLKILQEECAEIIQVCSKIDRFGFEKGNPFTKEFKSNRNHLIEELGDVMAMIDIIQQKYQLDHKLLEQARENKIEKLKRWSTIFEDFQLKTSIFKKPKKDIYETFYISKFITFTSRLGCIFKKNDKSFS